ncbi:hypothetical protein B0I72DRAFT_173262 [Yarrowia lipolytica]|nr:hypothetical protein B0I72DRAFT_173262 [Yarrowia lipolytica]
MGAFRNLFALFRRDDRQRPRAPERAKSSSARLQSTTAGVSELGVSKTRPAVHRVQSESVPKSKTGSKRFSFRRSVSGPSPPTTSSSSIDPARPTTSPSPVKSPAAGNDSVPSLDYSFDRTFQTIEEEESLVSPAVDTRKFRESLKKELLLDLDVYDSKPSSKTVTAKSSLLFDSTDRPSSQLFDASRASQLFDSKLGTLDLSFDLDPATSPNLNSKLSQHSNTTVGLGSNSGAPSVHDSSRTPTHIPLFGSDHANPPDHTSPDLAPALDYLHLNLDMGADDTDTKTVDSIDTKTVDSQDTKTSLDTVPDSLSVTSATSSSSKSTKNKKKKAKAKAKKATTKLESSKPASPEIGSLEVDLDDDDDGLDFMAQELENMKLEMQGKRGKRESPEPAAKVEEKTAEQPTSTDSAVSISKKSSEKKKKKKKSKSGDKSDKSSKSEKSDKPDSTGSSTAPIDLTSPVATSPIDLTSPVESKLETIASTPALVDQDAIAQTREVLHMEDADGDNSAKKVDTEQVKASLVQVEDDNIGAIESDKAVKVDEEQVQHDLVEEKEAEKEAEKEKEEEKEEEEFINPSTPAKVVSEKPREVSTASTPVKAATPTKTASTPVKASVKTPAKDSTSSTPLKGSLVQTDDNDLPEPIPTESSAQDKTATPTESSTPIKQSLVQTDETPLKTETSARVASPVPEPIPTEPSTPKAASSKSTPIGTPLSSSITASPSKTPTTATTVTTADGELLIPPRTSSLRRPEVELAKSKSKEDLKKEGEPTADIKNKSDVKAEVQPETEGLKEDVKSDVTSKDEPATQPEAEAKEAAEEKLKAPVKVKPDSEPAEAEETATEPKESSPEPEDKEKASDEASNKTSVKKDKKKKKKSTKKVKEVKEATKADKETANVESRPGAVLKDDMAESKKADIDEKPEADAKAEEEAEIDSKIAQPTETDADAVDDKLEAKGEDKEVKGTQPVTETVAEAIAEAETKEPIKTEAEIREPLETEVEKPAESEKKKEAPDSKTESKEESKDEAKPVEIQSKSAKTNVENDTKDSDVAANAIPSPAATASSTPEPETKEKKKKKKKSETGEKTEKTEKKKKVVMPADAMLDGKYYVYTSYGTGIRGIMASTNNLVNILAANDLEPQIVEITVLPRARRVWRFRGTGKELPAVVKDEEVLADYKEYIRFGSMTVLSFTKISVAYASTSSLVGREL